jgi:hypothetical protein
MRPLNVPESPSSLIEDTGKKKDWAQVGTINVAAAAALLGLRAALDLGSVGREQRIAAADQVDGALAVIQQTALAVDEDDIMLRSFRSCSDGERNVARTLARTDTTTRIEQILADTKANAKQAESKKEVATEKEEAAQKDLEAADSALSRATANKSLAEAGVDKAEAEVEIAKGEVAAVRLQVLRASAKLRTALLFFTAEEVGYALSDLFKAREDVLEAQRVVKDAESRLTEAKEERNNATMKLKAAM